MGIPSLIMAVLVASLSAAPAWAQTEPPPVGPEAPVAAPAAPAPLAPTPAPPAIDPATALPTGAPPPSLAAPAPMADPGALPPLPPTEERPPIYKQTWFWAVVAVVGLTAVMIGYGLGTQGPATPGTDLGNMRAF